MSKFFIFFPTISEGILGADPCIGNCPLLKLCSPTTSCRMFGGWWDLWDVGEEPVVVMPGCCCHGCTSSSWRSFLKVRRFAAPCWLPAVVPITACGSQPMEHAHRNIHHGMGEVTGTGACTKDHGVILGLDFIPFLLEGSNISSSGSASLFC